MVWSRVLLRPFGSQRDEGMQKEFRVLDPVRSQLRGWPDNLQVTWTFWPQVCSSSRVVRQQCGGWSFAESRPASCYVQCTMPDAPVADRARDGHGLTVTS